MITLGIETSCDECACGIVDDALSIRANRIFRQDDLHAQYGGVVPEIAARAHLEKIVPVVRLALKDAKLGLDDIDLFAFTRGPGLVGALLVGASHAQALAAYLNKPVSGVNHLEGHLAATMLSRKDFEPPFMCLTVSGGHTELCRVLPGFKYELVGRTRDDAAGEAFDKCGKILGLGYPAGPIVSKRAVSGDGSFISLPMGLDHKGNFEFSFSGLKTAFVTLLQKMKPEAVENHLDDLCASLESAIVEVLVKKTIAAAKTHGCDKVAVCGGVSANRHLRERMAEACKKHGLDLAIPEMALCTDNGAMIAGVAQMKYNQGLLDKDLTVTPGLSWGG